MRKINSPSTAAEPIYYDSTGRRWRIAVTVFVLFIAALAFLFTAWGIRRGWSLAAGAGTLAVATARDSLWTEPEHPGVYARTSPPAGSNNGGRPQLGEFFAFSESEIQQSGLDVKEWGRIDSGKAVLTFDDGPDPLHTLQILDILEEYQVHAVFFVVGSGALRHPEIIRRIVREGHEIGIHTFSHPDISAVSSLRLAAEISLTQWIVEYITGYQSRIFRAPFAEDTGPETVEQARAIKYVNGMGYYSVGMGVDSRDWEVEKPESIINRTLLLHRMGAGSIVLMHDGGGDRSPTAAALPGIIEGMKERGVRFATLSEYSGISSSNLYPNSRIPSPFNRFVDTVVFGLLRYSLLVLMLLFLVAIVLGLSRSLIISLLAFLRWRQGRRLSLSGPREYLGMASIIIPAYNEEKVICPTVESLLSSTYSRYEIIIVDDGSTDSTPMLVHSRFADHPCIRLYSIPNSGKSEALNYGIGHSRGDFLITLDADTQFTPETVERLMEPFTDPAVGAVAGNAKVGNRMNYLTYSQAFEYITGQNLERRSFDLLNCIPVVPGAVGAWRKEVVIDSGGFSSQTLAEDADLTFTVIRSGYRVVYRDDALGLTEAPQTVDDFVKQRVRWIFGTLQTAWKHRDLFMKKRHGNLGLLTIPNIYIFQLLLPLLAPIASIFFGVSLWSKVLGGSLNFGASMLLDADLQKVLIVSIVFIVLDIGLAAFAFFFEPAERKHLLVWAILQRLFYRFLVSFAAFKSLILIIKGSRTSWNKVRRTATVKMLKTA